MTFNKIRNYLNQDFERYISEWFPNAYRVDSRTWKIGDFNDTKTKRGDGSLVFNMREKYAKDFSTGETAGDIISIYAHRFCGGNQKKALKELIERYNLQDLVEPYKKEYRTSKVKEPLEIPPLCSGKLQTTDKLPIVSKLTSVRPRFPVYTGITERARVTESTVMTDNSLLVAPYRPSGTSPQGVEGLGGVSTTYSQTREGLGGVIDTSPQKIEELDNVVNTHQQGIEELTTKAIKTGKVDIGTGWIPDEDFVNAKASTKSSSSIVQVNYFDDKFIIF